MTCQFYYLSILAHIACRILVFHIVYINPVSGLLKVRRPLELSPIFLFFSFLCAFARPSDDLSFACLLFRPFQLLPLRQHRPFLALPASTALASPYTTARASPNSTASILPTPFHARTYAHTHTHSLSLFLSLHHAFALPSGSQTRLGSLTTTELTPRRLYASVFATSPSPSFSPPLHVPRTHLHSAATIQHAYKIEKCKSTGGMKRWQAAVQVGVVLSTRTICRITAFCALRSFVKEACLTRKPGTGRIVDHGLRRLKSHLSKSDR